jgi:hypothetical protein
LATAFGVIPNRRLKVASEACDRCIAARTACVALLWRISHIAPFHSNEWTHHQNMGQNKDGKL